MGTWLEIKYREVFDDILGLSANLLAGSGRLIGVLLFQPFDAAAKSRKDTVEAGNFGFH